MSFAGVGIQLCTCPWLVLGSSHAPALGLCWAPEPFIIPLNCCALHSSVHTEGVCTPFTSMCAPGEWPGPGKAEPGAAGAAAPDRVEER